MPDIKSLPKSVQESLRTGQNIKSYAICVAQLVYNSLDANATSIAIRVNLISHKIQIIDNGDGISKSNLKLIGEPYMTSKYYSMKDENKTKTIFGYRGETIFSICQLASSVNITSRTCQDKRTYSKSFENGKSLSVNKEPQRKSVGTTITIENFLYNNPVRQNYIENQTVLEEIKNKLESIVLIHPNTSFSLRNDINGEIFFQIPKTKYVIKSCEYLFSKTFSQHLRKINYRENSISLSGLISTQANMQSNVQFVYINKRNVKKTKIHDLINSTLIKYLKTPFVESGIPVKEKNAVYILSVSCPITELDIIDYSESIIEFKSWKKVLQCIKTALESFLKTEKLFENKYDKIANLEPVKSNQMQVIDLQNVIQGKKTIRKRRKESKTNLVELNIKKEKNSKNYLKNEKILKDFNKTKKSNLETEKSLKIGNDLNHLIKVSNGSEFGKKEILNTFLKSMLDKYENKISQNDLVDLNKNEIAEMKKSENKNCEVIKTVANNFTQRKCDGSNIDKNFIMDAFLKSTMIYKTDDTNTVCFTQSDNYLSIVSKTENTFSIFRNTLVSKKSNIISIKKCRNMVPKLYVKKRVISQKIILNNSNKLDINLQRNNFSKYRLNSTKYNTYQRFVPNKFIKTNKISERSILNNKSKKLHKYKFINENKHKKFKNEMYLKYTIPKVNSNSLFYHNSKKLRHITSNKYLKNYNNKIIQSTSINKYLNNHLNFFHNRKNKKFIFPTISSESTFSHRSITLYKSRYMNSVSLKNNMRNYLTSKDFINSGRNNEICMKPTKYIDKNDRRKYASYLNNGNNTQLLSLKLKRKHLHNSNKEYYITKQNKGIMHNDKTKMHVENNQISNTWQSHPNMLQKQHRILCKNNNDLFNNFGKDMKINRKVTNRNKNKDKSIKDSMVLSTNDNDNCTFVFEPNFHSTFILENNTNQTNTNKETFLLQHNNEDFNKRNTDFKTNNERHDYYKNKIVDEKIKSHRLELLQDDRPKKKTKYTSNNEHMRDVHNFKFEKSNNNSNKENFIFKPNFDMYLFHNRNNLIEDENSISSFLSTHNQALINKNDHIFLNNDVNGSNILYGAHNTSKNIKKSILRSHSLLGHESTTSLKIPSHDKIPIHFDDVICNDISNIPNDMTNIFKIADNTHSKPNDTKISSLLFSDEPIHMKKKSSNPLNIKTNNNLPEIQQKTHNKNDTVKSSEESSFLIINLDDTLPKHNTTFPKKNSAIASSFSNENENRVYSNNVIAIGDTEKENVDLELHDTLTKHNITVPKKGFAFASSDLKINENKLSSCDAIAKRDNGKENVVFKFDNTLPKNKTRFKKKNSAVASSFFNKIENKLNYNNAIAMPDNEKENVEFEGTLQKNNATFSKRNSIIDTIISNEKRSNLDPNEVLAMLANEKEKVIHEKKERNLNFELKNAEISSSFNVNKFLEIVYSDETKIDEQSNEKNTLLENKHYNDLNSKENPIKEINSTGFRNNLEWERKENAFGRDVFIHARTGMSIFQMPQNDSNYSITKRNSHMPKGMSPILFSVSKPSQELTPTSKDVLYQTMAKNDLNNDIKTIKWLKYFKDKDAVSFFGSLYEEMKYYESDIPNIKDQNLPNTVMEYKFRKETFKNLIVINQWDKKFILASYCEDKQRNILILFDQHAVDERIRLENLYKRYTQYTRNVYKKIKCKKIFHIKLSNTELHLLRNNHVQKQFENWGICYKMEKHNSVLITHIPLFLQSKDDSYKENREESSHIKQLLEFVIKEQDDFLKLNGKISPILPSLLLNIIKTEACRSAIKFGDDITRDNCIKLIENLSKCDLPFECAHGRPTVSLLANLSEITITEQVSEVNLKKIMKIK